MTVAPSSLILRAHWSSTNNPYSPAKREVVEFDLDKY